MVMDKIDFHVPPTKYVIKIFVNNKTSENTLLNKVTHNVIDLLVPGFDWVR